VSRTIRLEGADQTTVILVEDDYVAMQAFFNDPRSEDIDHPNAVMLYDAKGLESLAIALFQARIEMERESMGEFLRIVTDGFGCETL